MVRYRIIFKGQVQGVGFRWTLTQIASKYHLSGNCRNLVNGDVECFIQGENDKIDAFLADVLNAKGYIIIEDYAIKKAAIAADEKDFKPIY